MQVAERPSCVGLSNLRHEERTRIAFGQCDRCIVGWNVVYGGNRTNTASIQCCDVGLCNGILAELPAANLCQMIWPTQMSEGPRARFSLVYVDGTLVPTTST